MKQLTTLLLVVLASKGVIGSEVGAPNPQEKVTTVAVVDKGVSTSWAIEPFANKVTAHHIAELNSRVEQINAEMQSKLDSLIEQKMRDKLLAN